MKIISFLFALLFIPAFLSVSSSDAAVIVSLNNGNTLTANSYRIENKKVFLKYPVGEVEVPMSQVKSLKEDDGTVHIFQDQGIKDKSAVPAPAPVAQKPAFLLPVLPDVKSNRVGFTEADKKKWLDEHPQANDPPKPMTEAEQRADAFVDRYFAASDEDRAKMDKELDSVLDQLFNDNSDAGSNTGAVNK